MRSAERLITISSDEDQTTGFMFADDHAPATTEDRASAFARRALVEWDLVVDPSKLRGDDAPKPYVFHEASEELRPYRRKGQTIDSYWFVLKGLGEATGDEVARP